MKSRKLALGWWVLTGALLAAPAAWGVEALSTEELVSHCDKYHDPNAAEDRTFCVRYIQGFIDGAVATDERVTNNPMFLDRMTPSLDALTEPAISAAEWRIDSNGGSRTIVAGKEATGVE